MIGMTGGDDESTVPPSRLWDVHRWFLAVGAALITAVTLAVFGQLAAFDFINHDDPYFVTLNKFVTGGLTLENIRWTFSTRELGIWHPLTWMSYQLETSVFGADSPGPRHAVNLGVHLLNGILLFLLCLRLTGARWASLLVAILFCIHPQHVQPVAWIAERKEVLAAFFFLLSLYLYTVYRVRGNYRPDYFLSLAAFGLALLCKPSAAPLPVILLLIDSFYRSTDNKAHLTISLPSNYGRAALIDLFRNKIPFFVFSALVSGITIYIKKTGLWAGWEEILTFERRLLLMPIGMLHYLEKLFVPWPNPFWIEPVDGMPYLQSLLSFGVLLVLGYLVWRGRRRCTELLFGAMWFVTMWLPVSGIVLVSKHYVADRYTYLPYIGCLFGLVFLARAVSGSKALRPRGVFILGLAVVVAAAALSYRQTGYWRDSITFFQREIEINPRNAMAPLHVGQALMDAGEYEAALARFQTVIELDKNEYRGYSYKADALRALGREDEAIEAYRQAIEHRPHRGYPYVLLGRLLIDGGAVTDGVRVMQQGLQRFPLDVFLLVHLAHAYGFNLARPDRALNFFLRVLQVEPANTSALYGAAVLYLRKGEVDEGRRLLARLLEIDPGNATARQYLEQGS